MKRFRYRFGEFLFVTKYIIIRIISGKISLSFIHQSIPTNNNEGIINLVFLFIAK